jgi:hypothetical protein
MELGITGQAHFTFVQSHLAEHPFHKKTHSLKKAF